MCANGCGGCGGGYAPASGGGQGTLGVVQGAPYTNPFTSAPKPQPTSTTASVTTCPKRSLADDIFLALVIAVIVGFVFGGNGK